MDFSNALNVVAALGPWLSNTWTEMPQPWRLIQLGIITALALLGGIGGLIGTGQLIDAGWSYSTVIGMFALAQVVVTIIVITSYPETAHQELEDLNPEDATLIITGG